jgi:hypothetical protein
VARRRRALAGQDLRGDRQPRAAPPSQPWATICCAFGVEGRYQPPGWNVFVPRASSPSSGCPRAPNGAGDTSPERKPWVITPELTVPSTGLAQPERRAPEGMRGNRSRVERRGMAWEGRWSRGRDRSSAWNCRGRPSVPRHLDTATPNTDRHAQPEAWSGRGGGGPAPPPRPPPPPTTAPSAGTASAIVPACASPDSLSRTGASHARSGTSARRCGRSDAFGGLRTQDSSFVAILGYHVERLRRRGMLAEPTAGRQATAGSSGAATRATGSLDKGQRCLESSVIKGIQLARSPC